MNINISYTSEKPMYEQIKDSIKCSILNGEFKNNDMLPSVRQLAKDLNVSMITTKRAYTELELGGFLYTISGKGTFVKLESLNDVKAARNLELLNNFTEKVEEMKSAGILKKELEDKINSIYEGENKHE